MLLELLAGAELDPARVAAFNRYAALVQIGHNPVEGVLERSPLAVFEGLMAGIEGAVGSLLASRRRVPRGTRHRGAVSRGSIQLVPDS